MLSKEQYIWKAKHQRGLSDEQIQYFLDRDTRYDLMPYYSLCCKRVGCEQGYAKVVELYGADPELEIERATSEDYIILRNRARCLLCGDVLESQTRHDQKTCSCGNLTVDGGKDYLKRMWKHNESSFEEQNELKMLGPEWIRDPATGEWILEGNQ